eukprot:m.151999 g.151999  ORF g.151999 m.151999 type:complete len:346 (+) comp24529_c0_seq6:100-1137(+)
MSCMQGWAVSVLLAAFLALALVLVTLRVAPPSPPRVAEFPKQRQAKLLQVSKTEPTRTKAPQGHQIKCSNRGLNASAANLYFLKLLKIGGTTIADRLVSVFDEEFRCSVSSKRGSDHYFCVTHAAISQYQNQLNSKKKQFPNMVTIAVLREPRARYMSDVYFEASKHLFKDHNIQQLTSQQIAAVKTRTQHKFMGDLRQANLQNYYSDILSFHGDPKTALKDFDIVATTENQGELYVQLAYLFCLDPLNFTYHIQKKSVGRPTFDDLDDPLQRGLDKLFPPIETELWQLAQRESYLRIKEWGLEDELKRFQDAQAAIKQDCQFKFQESKVGGPAHRDCYSLEGLL